MDIKEISQVGKQVLQNKKALILGISINNSYFKEENLTKLLLWATENASSVYVMIPDEPAVHTLMALGKSESEAVKIARSKSNNLENKCLAIVQNHKLPPVTIVRWVMIANNEHYLRALEIIRQAYVDFDFFAKEVHATTLNVLKHAGFENPTDEQMRNGLEFLFKELAFITHSDLVLGQEKTAYVYHSTMKVLNNLIEGQYTFFKTEGVGFITAE